MLILPEGVEPILPSVESLLIGAALGIGVVLIINVSRNIFKISHSDDYGGFYNSRMNRLRDESRVRVLNSDEILKNFLCPLTKNLPNCPMLAPNHCTYDNTAINLFLFTYPDLTPPGGKMVFIASQLRFDFGRANAIIERMDDIIRAIKVDKTLGQLRSEIDGPSQEKIAFIDESLQT